MSRDMIVDDDFELSVAEGLKFKTLYVRVLDEASEAPELEISNEDLRKRAVEGSVDAQIGWARVLLHGHGIERDEQAAYRWFKIAARGGDAEALNMVGRCYEVGWGVAADPEEAVRWFRLAADKDYGWAQYNLGKLLARGHGGNRDPKVALTLLVRSARQGVPKAMNMLGRYRQGSDVPRRRTRSAVLWFRWAAEGGCFRGQFNYGHYLVTTGRVADGLALLRTSLGHAPGEYRQEALEIMRRDAHPALRELARERSGGE